MDSMKILLKILLVTTMLVVVSANLGCRTVCDQVDSLPNPYFRPGKRGPKGEPGQRGEMGLCPNVEALTSQLNDLQQESATLKNKLAMLEWANNEKLDKLESNLERKLFSVNEKIMQLESQQAYYEGLLPVTDCSQLNDERKSGIYQLRPFAISATPVRVLCDMDTSGGGWTVFQRRVDGSVDFYRGWQEYVDGFGDLEGEFWLGLENIHQLTTKYNMMLRVDLEDRDGNTAYAQYSTFKVAGSGDNYRLTIGGYSGTAGDSLAQSNNMMFTTHDRDNDKRSWNNCATGNHGGAWWHKSCHNSNLNGDYSVVQGWSGVMWWHWKNTVGLKSTQMSIKRQ